MMLMWNVKLSQESIIYTEWYEQRWVEEPEIALTKESRYKHKVVTQIFAQVFGKTTAKVVLLNCTDLQLYRGGAADKHLCLVARWVFSYSKDCCVLSQLLISNHHEPDVVNPWPIDTKFSCLVMNNI